jgi:hypothetical protein
MKLNNKNNPQLTKRRQKREEKVQREQIENS